MLEFGPLLRVCRTQLGLTQVEMADLLCISQPVYSRIETGQKPVSLKTLQRVADRAGMSIQTLILAHLLLDENLEAIEKSPRDGATKSLLQLAEDHRLHAPAGVRDGAALGLLLDSAPE
jgi:transcriptional regulator with XRE-family HTH domain